MFIKRPLQEKGQSLIVMAFAMVILLIFTAFAVDLGYRYVQRRQMQNAADAGALVGARELALHQAADISNLTNGQLYSIILDWAQRNRAQSIQPLYIREDGTKWALPNNGDLAPLNYTDACGVHVQANTTFQSFFARVLGITLFDVSAYAEAKYGGALSVFGPAPLAYEYQPDDFNVCNPEGDPPPDPEDCEFELFAGNDKNASARWGWLGLDCEFPSKCSPDVSSLIEWMRNGFPGNVDRYRNYMGDPGMAAAVLKEAEVGDILILPLFDQVFMYTDKDLTITGTVRCASYPNGNPYEYKTVDDQGGFYDGYVTEGPNEGELDPLSYCATECGKDYQHVWCSHTDNPVLTNSYYYHIVDFAAFKITEVSQGGHVLNGTFYSWATEGTWKKPTEWDKGIVIIHLAE